MHTNPSPTRAKIKPQVDHIFNATCHNQGVPTHPEPIDDGSDIEDTLELGPTIKGLLSIPYTVVTVQYVNGKNVSMADAAGCTTVGDAVDLVFKRATGH